MRIEHVWDVQQSLPLHILAVRLYKLSKSNKLDSHVLVSNGSDLGRGVLGRLAMISSLYINLSCCNFFKTNKNKLERNITYILFLKIVLDR